MPHPIEPCSFVLYTLLLIFVKALSVSETVLDVALIHGAIGPGVTARACDLVLSEFSLVDGAISPGELALTVEEAVSELALVGVPVSELACALPVENLADLIQKQNLNVSYSLI